MSTCSRVAVDGPFTPGRRSSCQLEGGKAPSCAPLASTFGPPSPRLASGTQQLNGQELWRRDSNIPGEGAARVARRRLPRLLSVLWVFWPVPAAAAAFLTAIVALGYTSWGQALPGVQAIFIMSLLQCCWAVMSSQGQRRLLRLTQLASALLGVLLLLPKRDVYGTRIWASAFDDEGGVILPGFAASLATLFGLMGDTTSANGKEAAQPGHYSLPEDAELHRALLRLEVSLAAVVVFWLLQACTASYACAAPAASAAAPGVALAALNPAMQSALKSHLDLPALESWEAVSPVCDLKLRPDTARPVGALDTGYDGRVAHPSSAATGGCGARGPQWHLVAHPEAELLLQQPQHYGKAPVAAAGAGQRVLLFGACAAQCAAATVIVATWDTFAERLLLQEASTSGDAEADTPGLPASFVATRPSWLALGLLAAAMSSTLALPALLRSRHLLHTALMVRPAATRSLGLLLLDLNAGKLLLAVSVSALGGWRAGALTWQLLQVCTMAVGIAKLLLSGLKVQLASAAASAAAGTGPGGGFDAAAEPAARLMLVVPGGAGCDNDAGGAAPPSCLNECSSVRAAAAASPRFADAVGRVVAGGALALQDRCGGATAAAAFRPLPEVGCPAALAPASCSGEAASSKTTVTVTNGGRSCSSSNTMHSPYSSGNSLASASADAEPHQLGCGGGGSGPSVAVASPSPATATALLARRPPPLAVGGGALQSHQLHNNQQPHCQSNHNSQHSSLLSSCSSWPGGSPRLLPPAAAARRQFASVACTARGCCGMSAAAVHPWSLLLASLSLLACMLWVALMAPPLAVLGDEPVDFFEALVDTNPGAVAMLTLLVGIAAAFTVSGTCLLWCIANGELRQRWRLNPVEGRRLECLAWACGPPLAVAAFSALSWALGDEHNAVAYVAAEVLRCASLWPLVWLQEPWMFGGVECVGGCAQHAGCGVTCCVLRWCGLRPSGSGALGARCDGRGREAVGLQLVRSTSRRGKGGSLQVVVK